MPVLLLAQGDQAARAILRQAIEARYGTRPPALDHLKIDFEGRAHVRVGPVKTWVPVDVNAYFSFPTAMRWDFAVKPMGLPVQRGVEAFDGSTFRSTRGSKAPAEVTDPALVQSMQRRLWAVAAILLTPLSDMFVKLTTTSNYSFSAINTQLNDSAEVFLRFDQSIDYVKVHCLNPDNNHQQDYTLYPSEELTNIDDLLLPSKIKFFWDETPYFEATPVTVDTNPDFTDEVFTIS